MSLTLPPFTIRSIRPLPQVTIPKTIIIIYLTLATRTLALIHPLQAHQHT